MERTWASCSEVGQRNVVADGDTGSRKDVLVEIFTREYLRLIKIGEMISGEKLCSKDALETEGILFKVRLLKGKKCGFQAYIEDTLHPRCGLLGSAWCEVSDTVMKVPLSSLSCFLMSMLWRQAERPLQKKKKWEINVFGWERAYVGRFLQGWVLAFVAHSENFQEARTQLWFRLSPYSSKAWSGVSIGEPGRTSEEGGEKGSRERLQ